MVRQDAVNGQRSKAAQSVQICKRLIASSNHPRSSCFVELNASPTRVRGRFNLKSVLGTEPCRASLPR